MAKSKLSALKRNDLISGLLFIAVGVLFCIFRNSILDLLLLIVGILFVIAGLVQIFADKQFLAGLILAAIGVVLIVGSRLFLDIVLIVFGVLYILKGIADLVRALQTKRKNGLAILTALLCVALGVLLIVLRSSAVSWLFIVIGVIFIVQGAVAVLSAVR